MAKREVDTAGGLDKIASATPPASKQPRLSSDATDEEVQVKVLVPAAAVGGLIGKGGEGMRKLKHDSACYLRLSKNNEFYPGTNERLLLARGRVSNVLKVLRAVGRTVREKVDDATTRPDAFDQKNADRSREMKLLVPNTSAGMVIGKQGARIKEIREQTGAHIQVFPKQGSPEALRSAERVITLVGEPAQLEAAAARVLDKVASDPHHADNADLAPLDGAGGARPDDPYEFGGGGGAYGQPAPHYAHYPSTPNAPPRPLQRLLSPPDYAGDLPRAPAGASAPYSLLSQPAAPHRQPQHTQQQQLMPPAAFAQPTPPQHFAAPQRAVLAATVETLAGRGDHSAQQQQQQLAVPASGAVKPSTLEHNGNAEVLQFLDSLQLTLRASGFGEQPVGEIMQAMQVLARYNIMGLGLGLGVAAMATMRANRASTPAVDARPSNQQQPQQQVAPPPQQQQQQPPQQRLMPDRYDNGGGGDWRDAAPPPTYAPIRERPQMDPSRLELEVEEAAATATFMGTQVLADVQRLSGARVDLLARRPGAAGRALVLTGEPDAVRAARLMLERAVTQPSQAQQPQQPRSYY